jgi:NitT/TauT family transport system permease protein
VKPRRRIFRRAAYLLNKGAVLLTLIALIAFWQVAVAVFEIPKFLLPAPTAIWSSMIEDWAQLLQHAGVTLAETLAGFGLSIAIGIPLAVCIVASSVLERVIYPLLVASQAVPKVALAPILLVALGYGTLPKVIVAFLIAFFPIVVNSVTGLGTVNRDLLRLLRSMGASGLDVFLKVRFPHAVPTVIAGLKVAIALAVVGAVVGEFVGGRSGLGYLMLVAMGNFNTPLIFACVIVLTIMGIALFYLVSVLDFVLWKWNRTAIQGRAEEDMSWAM